MRYTRFVILGLALVVLLHMAAFAVFSSRDDLIDKPLGEDAYYMFSIARNIARGSGVVYNDAIPTNGFQPLVMLPYTAIYALDSQFDLGPWLPLRLILLLNLLLLAATGIVARNAVRTYGRRRGYDQDIIDTAGDLTLLFVVVNINLLRIYLYGLETGLYLFLIVLLIARLAAYSSLSEVPARETLFLGILSGLAILARIDFIILLGGMLVIYVITDRQSRPQALKIALIAAVVAAPWFIYNYVNFGSFMPSSGTAQATQELSITAAAANASRALWTIVDQGLMLFWLPQNALPFTAVFAGLKLLAIAAIGVFVGRYVWSLVRWPFHGLLFGYLLLVAAYTILISATHFYQRYFAPGLMLWVLLFSIGLALLLSQRAPESRARVLLGLSMLTFVVYGVFAAYTLHRGTVSNNHVYTVRWLDENLADDARVGAFQSGVIGYFHENVTNLDGKVNPDALAHWLADDLDCYVLNEELAYVIDWPGYLERLGQDFLASHTHEIAQIPGGSSVVLAVDLGKPYPPCQFSGTALDGD